MLETYEVTNKAISMYGGVYQSMIAMEECSELAQAISKMIRTPERKQARTNLVEEMADVLICLGELKEIYSVTDQELEHCTANKLKRLERRLSDETD